MKKGGLSAIVATVLIILLVIVAVSIFWLSILPMLNLDASFSSVRLDVVIDRGYTFYDAETDILSVQIARGVDSEDITNSKIIISYGGNSFPEYIITPLSGERKTYCFDVSAHVSNYGIPEGASVAPIF